MLFEFYIVTEHSLREESLYIDMYIYKVNVYGFNINNEKNIIIIIIIKIFLQL